MSRPSSDPPVQRDGRPFCVLVVAQAPRLRDSWAAALEQHGLQVVQASNSREALIALEEHVPAALVADSRLPITSGFDLAWAVRRQLCGEGVAIVVVTDVSWPEERRSTAMQQMGLVDLLLHPVDPDQLARVVVQALLAVPPGPRQPDEPADAVPETGAAAGSALEPSPARLCVQISPLHGWRGSLAVTPFSRLLQELHEGQATGALFLLRDRVKKIVYLDQGSPVDVKSNLLTECLGMVLMHEGAITSSQCQESIKRMRRTGEQQGSILLQIGAIRRQDLVMGLQVQLKVKLLEIFGWTRGEFLFRGDTRLILGRGAAMVDLGLSTAEIIAEGIRTQYDQERLEQAAGPHLDRVPQPNPEPRLRCQQLGLAPEEQALLDAVDGTRTMREILSNSPLPRRKALTVACILLATQVIRSDP